MISSNPAPPRTVELDGPTPWSSRAAQKFAALTGALLLVAWCARPDAQPDLYFHLACGSWILEHGFPRENVFLDPRLVHAFVGPEWGFQLLVLALESLGGARLLGLVKTAVVLSLIVLVLRPLRGSARWALLIPFVLLAGPRFVIRPELVSYLGVAWHLSWRKAPEGRRLGWAVGAQIAWANLHGFALLGPALCGVRAGVAVVRGRPAKRWALATAVLLACCLLTPYPLGTLAYLPRVAWEATGSGRLPLAELAAPWSAGAYDPTWLLLLSWTVLSTPLAWIGWRSGRLPLDRAAVAVCVAVLGFPYVRNLPLAALALVALSGPGLNVVCARLFRGRRSAPVYVLLGVLAFGLARATVDDRFHTNPQVDTAAGFDRVAFKAYPEAAESWAKHPLRTPVFCGFSSGHFLIWAGLRPSICGNLDLYPRTYYAAYRELLEGDPREFGERLSAAGYASAFLDHRELSPLLVEALVLDPEWGLRYVGPKALVFERGAAASSALLTEAFPDEEAQGSILRALTVLPQRALHPRLRLHLARVLPAVGQSSRAVELVRGALQLAPHDPVVLAAAAEVERHHGDPQRAWELVQRWVKHDPTAEACVALGSLAMARGAPRRALKAYRAALAAEPDPGTALRARINLLAAAEAAEDPVAIRRAVALHGAHLDPALRAFYRGNAARLEADYPTARHWLTECVTVDPSRVPGWARLGEVEFLAAEYPAAVAAYTRLVALSPDAASWRDLGVAHEQAGDDAAALAAWSESAAADPSETLSFIYTAKHHMDRGQRKPALVALRGALARDPRHPTARKLLLKLRGGG